MECTLKSYVTNSKTVRCSLLETLAPIDPINLIENFTFHFAYLIDIYIFFIEG